VFLNEKRFVSCLFILGVMKCFSRFAPRHTTGLVAGLFLLVLVGCGGHLSSLPGTTDGTTSGDITSLTQTGEAQSKSGQAFGPEGSVVVWDDTTITVQGHLSFVTGGLPQAKFAGYFNGTVFGTYGPFDDRGAWIGTLNAAHEVGITNSFPGADIGAYSPKTGEVALEYLRASDNVLTKLSVLSASGTVTDIPIPSGMTAFGVTAVGYGQVAGVSNTGAVMILSATAAPVTLQTTAPVGALHTVTVTDLAHDGRAVGLGLASGATPAEDHALGLIWSATGALTVTPSGPFTHTAMTAISDKGIVGTSWTSNGRDNRSVALIYQGGSVVDANTLLPTTATNHLDGFRAFTDDGHLLADGKVKGSESNTVEIVLTAH